MTRLRIEPVTRIEGHAKISIELDATGAARSARFHVTEFRGFEKLCEGRPFHEMPGIMARVCGICPVSHILASSRAGDMLLGVDPPPAAQCQRRLVNYAQILQSHALSFFYLAAPDLLLGMDAPPARRNLLGVLGHEPDFMRRGIRLRQFGQRIIETIGGKRVHPGWSGPGGVHRRVTTAQRDEMRQGLPEALATVVSALDRLKRELDRFGVEIDAFGSAPSLFLGTVSKDGGLEYYDGTIRIVDASGNCVAEGLDPRQYSTFLAEASEEWTRVKFPYYQPHGYAQGSYRVGPLARLNVARVAGTAAADRELREFKQRSAGAVSQSFHYHLARLVEMLHCLERIEQLLEDRDLLGEEIQARAWLNHREGVGSCEAPRGTLFHDYRVDDNGLVISANLLIATGQNNRAMNAAVDQAARRFLAAPAPAGGFDEGLLNRLEAAIRCFDPCLSCSTHALGQMPLIVELHGPDGALQRRIVRD